MIVDAVVKNVTVDETHSRLEAYSPRYPAGKALVYLPPDLAHRPIKFITGWEDIMEGKKPFTLNGGLIDNNLIGNSTLIRGMIIERTDDNAVYVVMDPTLIS